MWTYRSLVIQSSINTPHVCVIWRPNSIPTPVLYLTAGHSHRGWCNSSIKQNTVWIFSLHWTTGRWTINPMMKLMGHFSHFTKRTNPNGLFFMSIICFLLHLINSPELFCVLTWSDTTQPPNNLFNIWTIYSLNSEFSWKKFPAEFYRSHRNFHTNLESQHQSKLKSG